MWTTWLSQWTNRKMSANIFRGGGCPPLGVRVYDSANLIIPDNTWITLTFDSERSDVHNMHSLITNTGRITFPVEGWAVVSGNIAWSNDNAGRRDFRVRLNGTDTIAQVTTRNSGGNTNEVQALSTNYYFSQNDYVELQARRTSSAVRVDAIPQYSPEFGALLFPC